MKDTYTTALLDLLTPDADAAKVLSGFKATLTARGHDALYGPVLGRVLRRLAADRPATVAVVASESAYAEQKAAIEAALKELGTDAEPAVTIDETIVGGFIAEHGSQRQDNSYKSKLVSLYRNLTN